MKAVILARVSTEMQEDGFSLDAQLDRLRNYCSLKDLEIAKEFTFVESSFHGKRTKFYEAVNYIKRQSIFRIFMKNSFPRSYLINAPKCGQESSNEPPNTPKNPTFFGGWFVANIVVVCFRLIQKRGSMFICGTLTLKIANIAIMSVRKFC